MKTRPLFFLALISLFLSVPKAFGITEDILNCPASEAEIKFLVDAAAGARSTHVKIATIGPDGQPFISRPLKINDLSVITRSIMAACQIAMDDGDTVVKIIHVNPWDQEFDVNACRQALKSGAVTIH
jgi:hypothetical protein